MPHQCTNCGRQFADGSKEMLSGCPDCGGNKFQFQPASATRSTSSEQSSTEPTSTPTPTEPSPSSGSAPHADSDDGTDMEQPSTAASEEGTGPSDSLEPPPEPESAPTEDVDGPAPETGEADADDAEVEAGVPPETEDHAQASARTDMVTPDELADAATPRAPPSEDDVDGRVIEPQSDDRPGLDELREELNSQFESIKIVSPGQYELNLMELYDRQEYIISLQEDGRYVIEVPDSWGDIDER